MNDFARTDRLPADKDMMSTDGTKAAGVAKEAVYSERALHSGALYSQAIRTGDWVYVAGQVPVDPVTKQPQGGSVYEQSCAVLGYIEAILTEAGCRMDDVVKMNCYLTDLAQFSEMNRAFASYFKEPYPARVTVGVQLIGFDVEMDCVARIGCGQGGGTN